MHRMGRTTYCQKHNGLPKTKLWHTKRQRQDPKHELDIKRWGRTFQFQITLEQTDERITSTLDVLQLKLATQQMWSSKTMDWIKRDGGMRVRENVPTANRTYMRQYANMHIDAHRKKVVHGHPYLKLKLWQPSWNRSTTKTMDWIMVESKHCEVWSIMKEEKTNNQTSRL